MHQAHVLVAESRGVWFPFTLLFLFYRVFTMSLFMMIICIALKALLIIFVWKMRSIDVIITVIMFIIMFIILDKTINVNFFEPLIRGKWELVRAKFGSCD